MYEHNALGYWSGLTLCLTKVRSSRACCPATALIFIQQLFHKVFGRFHRFPAQSLCVSGSFCVICIENMLHFP